MQLPCEPDCNQTKVDVVPISTHPRGGSYRPSSISLPQPARLSLSHLKSQRRNQPLRSGVATPQNRLFTAAAAARTDVEQIGEDVQLDVDALDLPIELAQTVLGAEDGNAPDRIVGDTKSGGGRRMLDYDGVVDAL